MKINTELVSGAGNTFHICFNIRALSLNQKINLVKYVCRQDRADGFIFLESAGSYDGVKAYEWQFFNNDGSVAEMCGNATRCVGFYIKNIIKDKDDVWQLKTVAGLIKIESISSEEFKITMTPIQKLSSALGFYCDTGVPHVVIENKTIFIDEKLKQAAQGLRRHENFKPRGTNVTYVALNNENKQCVSAVSYERGVEDFTAACGTGAVAAAFYNLTKRGVNQTQVEMPGGTLMMNLSDLSRPTMSGPAMQLGSYEYEFSN